MSNKNNLSQTILWKILPFVMILLYLAGMFLMIFGQFGNGVTLWALSTIGGGLMLYVRRTQQKKAADEREMEEAERAYQQTQKEEQEQ